MTTSDDSIARPDSDGRGMSCADRRATRQLARRRRRQLAAGLGGGLVALATAAAASLAGAGVTGTAEGAGEAMASTGTAASLLRQEPVMYGRDIRPILSDRCFLCHGPDAGTRAAGLRLDQRESAVDESRRRPAIVPGDRGASELWARITSAHADVVMPPPDANKRAISHEERELIGRWIDAGAPYEAHWAFEPAERPEIPTVQDRAWGRGPIDAFVLDGLEARGVRPSADAAPDVWLRRVFLDLTGLPPTVQELDAFAADLAAAGEGRAAADAVIERWVDRLLEDEPYRTRTAERLAVPWMDAARYADTIGIHTDNGRQMWLWRDWVLQAFRDNMPYDRFVTEQLAGDLIENATTDQLIATGFNRAHVITDEGGAINEEALDGYAVDRSHTTATVMMGLTLECARCHDHKYDPITQEDFYSFYAYFNSIEEPGLYTQQPDPLRAHEPMIDVPTDEQIRELQVIEIQRADHEAERAAPSPEEIESREAFYVAAQRAGNLEWFDVMPVAATSEFGATLTIDDSGAVVATGENPDRDVYHIEFDVPAVALSANMLRLDVLPDPSRDGDRRPGRAANGNAVVTGISLEVVGGAPAEVRWAWVDDEQDNGDYGLLTAIDARNPVAPLSDRGWAPGGHMQEGGRAIILLFERPVSELSADESDPDSLRVRLTLRSESKWDLHTLARVRPVLGRIDDASFLPLTFGHWYLAGPFPVENRGRIYDDPSAAALSTALDRGATFGAPPRGWRHDASYQDEQVNQFGGPIGVTVFARTVLAAADTRIPVQLGSDDGIRVSVNGTVVFERRVDRGAAPNQDQAVLPLRRGANHLVMEIMNTGGPGGMYFRAEVPAEGPGSAGPGGTPGWTPPVVLALLPESARDPEMGERLDEAWSLAMRPRYRELTEMIASLDARETEIRQMIPRTIIMKELAEPRPTFVLDRGQYDQPLADRPVRRRPPGFLDPANAAAELRLDRLGLAEWLTQDDHPLTARVAVNRAWAMIFGRGLVATPEDFGLQGAWPSHPELLDWLAVEFVDRDWNMRSMLREMVLSSTYRQSSAPRVDLAASDPENIWLAAYPRRRLPAEMIRDGALHVGGLLVEQFGGPPVKPYQPDGLWREVAMQQSNTRIFVAGQGEELYRRSLYTYFKRASPPPSMVAFDASAREACSVQRTPTDTPLQALVLWNDVQFVEAARALADRALVYRAAATIANANGVSADASANANTNDANANADASSLAFMHRTCTATEPDDQRLAALQRALADFRESWADRAEDATSLVQAGATGMQLSPHDDRERAAWTMVASAIMNLYRTTTQN
ncbi:MAG: PSD1 and planctomycete cytochrome C domain-containing protein [Phycisphaerales bacterium]